MVVVVIVVVLVMVWIYIHTHTHTTSFGIYYVYGVTRLLLIDMLRTVHELAELHNINSYRLHYILTHVLKTSPALVTCSFLPSLSRHVFIAREVCLRR